MSLKKPRIHISGISNIDYKSKKEIEKIFNNFKNYTIKPDKKNEPLDPSEIVVYKSQRPKKPNMYNAPLKDVKELDGDSLLYADTYKLRKEMKLKRLEQNVNNKIKNNGLPKVPNSSEKKVINYFKTEQNKQNDETRLKALRRNVHEKLIPHKNIQNIFVSWQKNYLNNNELSVFELHKRINELGIPISYNETIGLISLANKRKTNTLNLDEFKNLFFVDSDDINQTKNFSSIKIPENINSKKIEDDYKKEDERKYKKYINNKIFDNSHYNQLEYLLHIKYSNFLNSMNELNNKENNKKGLCDYETFKSVLDTLKIPEKYKNVYIAQSIFNEFKEDNVDLMNYNNFIERCKNNVIKNDFFEFQNKYLNLISNKLSNNESQRNKYKDILLENDKRTKEYIKNLGPCKSMDKLYNNNKCMTEENNQNIQKNNLHKYKLKNNITIDLPNFNNKRYSTLNTQQNNINGNESPKNPIINHNSINNNIQNRESFSHYQPSLNFINLLFKDSKSLSERYHEGVKEFSPNNVMNLKKNKRPDGRSINCRFFEKKEQFPPLFMSYDSKVPGYIDEKGRFERNKVESKYDLDMINQINRKKTEIFDKWNDNIKFQQNVLDVKESLGQINRTKHLFEYENRNISNNTFNE